MGGADLDEARDVASVDRKAIIVADESSVGARQRVGVDLPSNLTRHSLQECALPNTVFGPRTHTLDRLGHIHRCSAKIENDMINTVVLLRNHPTSHQSQARA